MGIIYLWKNQHLSIPLDTTLNQIHSQILWNLKILILYQLLKHSKNKIICKNQ